MMKILGTRLPALHSSPERRYERSFRPSPQGLSYSTAEQQTNGAAASGYQGSLIAMIQIYQPCSRLTEIGQ